MKKLRTLIAILLVAALGVLGILQLLSPDKDFTTQERRPLAQAPAFSMSGWLDRTFMSGAEKWLADQFTARGSWLSLKAQSQALQGQKDNGRVYFGHDNYLIEIHESLDEARLKRNVGDVLYFVENFWSETRPVNLLLAPTVAGVEPERLPAGHVEAEQAGILAELIAQAAAGGLEAPNLLEHFRNHGDAQLFFRTDHHWTQHGAKEAYRAWIGAEPEGYSPQTVTEDFRGTTLAKAGLWTVPPDTIEAYQHPGLDQVKLYDREGKLIREGLYNEAALETYDPYEYFVGENRDILKLETGTQNGKHLLLFKDSFANAFVPFLCRDYESITMVDLRYLNVGMTEILGRENFTEAMFLYNLVTLADENSTFKLMR